MGGKRYLIVVDNLLFRGKNQEFNKTNSHILKMKIPNLERLNDLANSSN